MNAAPLRSCLYEGTVRHRRFAAPAHGFTYGVSMLYLDLAEEDRVFRGRWLWSAGRRNLVSFRREDHLGDPAVPLDAAVRDLVVERSGRRPEGAVRLLTLPRYAGHAFNPVSFYFCFDAEDRAVETVVAEVNNTPWGERHVYVLGPRPPGAMSTRGAWTTPKALHVSPFHSMDLTYLWRWTTPGPRLAVHMDVAGDRARVMDATLVLRRVEITGATLASALARFPLQSVGVLAAIYGEAARLRWKGARFHAHPASRGDVAAHASPEGSR